MKNKLIAAILFFLMIMNGVLLYLVLSEPGPRKRPPHDFIINELNLTADQTQEFRMLEGEHRIRMKTMDGQLREMRHMLFSNTQNEDFLERKRDSIVELMGWLHQQKDLEVFNHFKRIGDLCTPEQRKVLESILSETLRRGPGRKGPPEGHMGPPPPREH
ncbi:Spy/CpxP family protein refolding chaperone [Flagellimonas flava]|uniref:Spy/CpxP family protein refolding chaperone n=1 Tax=Flagellimonas flava TaxID=570519 RepID=UPI003D656129